MTALFEVQALVPNSNTAAGGNTQKILDAIAAAKAAGGGTVVLPASGNSPVTDYFAINATIILPSGVTLKGAGADNTTLTVVPGVNADAVISNEAWFGTSAPASAGRGIEVRDLGIDGNFLNRTSGALQQSAGKGHGIAMAGYRCVIDNVRVQNTRGHGIFFDTANRSGVGLGEGIENRITGCMTIRTGLTGIHFDDTGNVEGGTTDGFIVGNVVAHPNMRNSSTDDEGHGIFCKTAGGHYIQANHVYASTDFAGQYVGYGVGQSAAIPGGSRLRDGIKLLSCSGTRVVGNQVADFGYQTSGGATTVYGINAQGRDDRGFLIEANTIWTDEDARVLYGVNHTYWAIRVTGVSGVDSYFAIVGNVAKPRDGSSLNGVLLNTAGTANRGTLTGNNMAGCPGKQFDGTSMAASGDVVQSGNSWQRASSAPNKGYWPAGTWVYAEPATGSSLTGSTVAWVCVTSGSPGTWRAIT